MVGTSATIVGRAIRGCASIAAAIPLVAGCAGDRGPANRAIPDARGVASYVALPPSHEERYCAWYGAPGSDGVLYFGEAAFWSAKAAAKGDPTADLQRLGPQLIGRFDLEREHWLPPLEVGTPESRSGVWDVLVGQDGEVYFTTFFEEAGSVAPATGRVRRLALGGALNELGSGPFGTILATRYGSGKDDAANGDVIAFDSAGHTVKQWPLAAPPGYRVAPKTPVWDDRRQELWLTADQLPLSPPPDAPLAARHEALRIEASGRVQILPAVPELMFGAAARDGTLYLAFAHDSALWLQVVPAPGRGKPHRVPLDDAFAPGLDFVQDIQIAADGRVAVTRWSGIVHVLHPDGHVGSVALPHLDPAGLYYTAVLHGDRLCSTYCADVTIVCADAP